jgi:hypothetical protein
MLKPLIASVAAFTFMTGLAFAQDQQTTTQQKTIVQGADGSQAVEANKTEQTTNADGSQTMAKKSFSKTDDANGTQMSRTRQEQTNSPDGSATTSKQTTTTSSPN